MFNVLNNTLLIIVAAVVLLLVMGGSSFLRRRKKPHLDAAMFKQRWQDVQKLCKQSETWPLAIIDADKLLDEALKKSKFKGRTMRERLVAAQRSLSDNDGVWFAHKLRNKILHDEVPKLSQRDVQNALKGLRQALKD